MTTLHGTYRARALSGGLSFAGNGTERVGIDFQIIEGPSQGQNLTYWGYFTDKAVERTIESLRICGWRGDDLADLSGITDHEVDLVVEPEEYQDKRTGELRTIGRIKWINRPSGMSVRDAMNPAQAREFAARMRGKVVSLGAPRTPQASAPANGPTRRPGPPLPAQVIDETDEIPF